MYGQKICAPCAHRAICGMTRSTMRKQGKGGLTMDLISREAAIEAIRDLQLDPSTTQLIYSSDAIDAVKKQPAVDAVPVTRCTACKHWDAASGLTARKCDKWDAFTTQWDYCSYGRKTDGTDNP
jgi:hypothetical protein